MKLATLVDLLEREMPGIGEGASTRNNLAQLYSERGCHDDARRARVGATAAPKPTAKRRRAAAVSGRGDGR